MNMKSIIAVIVVVAGLIYLNGLIFIVPEGAYALITQFGEIQGEPIAKAGLHFKKPFVNDVRYFDKRILSWDGDQEQITTKDRKFIWVDTTARWRIIDPRKFAETVQSENGARDRLDGILDGVTRDTISNYNLVEAVRNSNLIFEQLAARKTESDQKQLDAKKDGVSIAVEEEITGEIDKVSKGREQLSKLIIERTMKELEPFGIELVDVQLRRIAYEKSVEDKVYERMISERNRIAEKIRSIGKGEDAIIRGTLNKDLKEIESDAYRKGQEIKGAAEAMATKIYADSIREDPEYFAFVRTMEAYKRTLGSKGKLVLSTESDFLKYLERRP